jgi:hypothetical protein
MILRQYEGELQNGESFPDITSEAVNRPEDGQFLATRYYLHFLGTLQGPAPLESVGIAYQGTPLASTFISIEDKFIHGVAALAPRVQSAEEIFIGALLGTNEYFPRGT